MKIFRNKKGQSIVEAALILPVLLMILLMIFEIGRIFNADLIITQASREGARKAIVGADDTEIANVISSAASTLAQDTMFIVITPRKDDRYPGDAVTVEVQYKVKLYTPIISSMITNPFPISSKTVMRYE